MGVLPSPFVQNHFITHHYSFYMGKVVILEEKMANLSIREENLSALDPKPLFQFSSFPPF